MAPNKWDGYYDYKKKFNEMAYEMLFMCVTFTAKPKKLSIFLSKLLSGCVSVSPTVQSC